MHERVSTAAPVNDVPGMFRAVNSRGAGRRNSIRPRARAGGSATPVRCGGTGEYCGRRNRPIPRERYRGSHGPPTGRCAKDGPRTRRSGCASRNAAPESGCQDGSADGPRAAMSVSYLGIGGSGPTCSTSKALSLEPFNFARSGKLPRRTGREVGPRRAVHTTPRVAETCRRSADG